MNWWTRVDALAGPENFESARASQVNSDEPSSQTTTSPHTFPFVHTDTPAAHQQVISSPKLAHYPPINSLLA